MRTIYLVCGTNHGDYEEYRCWNVQAFNFKEDAERFIIEKQEEYRRDMIRIDELNDKWDNGAITDEEKAECFGILNEWYKIVDTFDPEHEWYVSEIQFQE